MPTQASFGGNALTDRDAERELLDQFLEAVRAGESPALVLRGDPQMGKTALLEHLVGSEHGCRVLGAVGVQSEMELAYGGLRRLCAPVLDDARRLPPPQRAALLTASAWARVHRRLGVSSRGELRAVPSSGHLQDRG
jgi:AAA ATPase domain